MNKKQSRPKVMFTSDTHFGHKNIIKFCSRPFDNSFHMDAELLRRWNDCVSDDDVVVHLGDVTLCNNPEKQHNVTKVLCSLNGHKVLIRGNHDKQRMCNWYRDQGWLVFDELQFDILGSKILLRHIPDGDDIGLFKHVIHGHVHGRSSGIANWVDVGVDAIPGYAPVQLENFLPSLCGQSQLEMQIMKLFCKKIIPNTLIACGEGDQFCSDLCMKLAD